MRSFYTPTPPLLLTISASFYRNLQLPKATLATVSDNTRLALPKTFQDFGFFFDVNQTVTIASSPCLSNKGGNNKQKQQN